MTKFLTVSAPIGRTTPISPKDGNDPAGVLLLVTSKRVARVRYSAEIRKAIADGDLFPVRLTETIAKDGKASYQADVVEAEANDLEADAMLEDGKHPKVKAKQFKSCALKEAWSNNGLANGDVVDMFDDAPVVRADPAFDAHLADIKAGGGATISTIDAPKGA